MKKTVLVTLLATAAFMVLTSCASFPKPEADSDTLVVGSVVLDFPDGFFSQPPKTITSGIRLDFKNVTTGKDFTILTGKDGYFYFLSNGTDSYMFTSLSYQVDLDNGGYYRGSYRPGIRFQAQPACVLYVGHLTYLYKSPLLVRSSGQNTTQWHFVTDNRRDYKKDDVQAWLQEKAPDSAWLSRDMKVEFGK